MGSLVSKQDKYPIVGGKITGEGLQAGETDRDCILDRVIGAGTFPYAGVGGFSEEFPAKRSNTKQILPGAGEEIPVGRARNR